MWQYNCKGLTCSFCSVLSSFSSFLCVIDTYSWVIWVYVHQFLLLSPVLMCFHFENIYASAFCNSVFFYKAHPTMLIVIEIWAWLGNLVVVMKLLFLSYFLLLIYIYIYIYWWIFLLIIYWIDQAPKLMWT